MLKKGGSEFLFLVSSWGLAPPTAAVPWSGQSLSPVTLKRPPADGRRTTAGMLEYLYGLF